MNKKVHPIFNNRWAPLFELIGATIFYSVFGLVKGMFFFCIFEIVIALVKKTRLITRIVESVKRNPVQ